MVHETAGNSRPGALPAWRYASLGSAGAIEFGSWSGPGSRSLRPHFHDEVQVTLVFAGCRAFRVEDEVVVVKSGHGIVVPAGRLHAPVAIPDIETACLNVYVQDDLGGGPLQTFELRHSLFRAGPPSLGMISRLVQDILPGGFLPTIAKANAVDFRAALAASEGRVGEIAAKFRMTREGFSRRVRRELDVAPHGFRIVSRLNHARRLLRDGQQIAAVAAEAGFSDQSHLTRLFRETFGTTPCLYQRG